MNKELIAGLGIGFIAGALAGAAGVYLVGKREFDKRMNEEAMAIRMDYARHYAGPQKPAIDEVLVAAEAEVVATAAERLAKAARAQSNEIIHELNYADKEPEEVVVPEEHNVFDENSTTTPLADRTPDVPYLISVEEFMDDEPVYEKITLTYFEEDDTLIEEKDDSIIDDSDTCVGDHNLLQFGYDPRDKDTIHVRNERLESDFEVTRDERSYTEAILGFREADKVKRGPGRFKEDD